MKTRMVLMCLLLPLLIEAQSVADDFYFAHKDRNNSLSLNIGNLLLTAGSWFVEDSDAKTLIKKSRRARFLFANEENFVSQREIKYLIKDLKSEGFESLAKVRSKDTQFNIYLREDRKGNITNIVALLNEPHEFGMISLDCKFRMDDLQCLHDDLRELSHDLRVSKRSTHEYR